MRQVVETMLSSYGYEVLTAADVRTAEALLEEHEQIDLVLSDVVLNGPQSGEDPARGLMESRPLLPVLLMSGLRAGDAAVSPPVGNVPLLQKPFEMQELASACKNAIAARRDRSQPN